MTNSTRGYKQVTVTDYPCIEAWGWLMVSGRHYIDAQIKQAREDNAPRNAIFKGNDGWHTLDGTRNPTVFIDMRNHGVPEELFAEAEKRNNERIEFERTHDLVPERVYDFIEDAAHWMDEQSDRQEARDLLATLRK